MTRLSLGLVLLVFFGGWISAGCNSNPTRLATNEPPTETAVIVGPLRPTPRIAVAAEEPTAVPTPRIGGSITLGANGFTSRQVTSLPAFVSSALYDSLLAIDPHDGSYKPALAQSWQVSDDARTFTFHLRSGVRWHDGQPLTSADAAWTITTLADPKSRLTPAADFGPLDTVTVPDAQTLVVRFKEGYCPALAGIGALRILPEHVLKGKDLSALKNADLIGTGPLVLQDWTGTVITFKRNTSYWDGPVPIVDWTLRLYPDRAAAQAALAAGQLDLLDDELAPGQLSAGSSKGELVYSENRFYSLAFNLEAPPLTDANVRQAIVAALDRNQLAFALYGDHAQSLATSLLPAYWAFPQGMISTQADLDRARQILQAAGWTDTDGDGIRQKGKDRLRLTLWATGGDRVTEPLALAIRAMLAQVGIQTLVQLDDRSGFYTRLMLREYDLAIAEWNIPQDPDQHWYWATSEGEKGNGLNVTGYSNRRVDQLLSQGRVTPRCDQAARGTIYGDLFRSIAADNVQIPLFAPPAALSVPAWLDGPDPSPFAGPFWNLSSWQSRK